MKKLVVDRNHWLRGGEGTLCRMGDAGEESKNQYCIVGHLLWEIGVPSYALLDQSEISEVIEGWAEDNPITSSLKKDFREEYDIPNWLNNKLSLRDVRITNVQVKKLETNVKTNVHDAEGELIVINDAKDVPDEIREAWLKQYLAEKGFDLQFIN